jgi:hypothetical protein
MILKKGANIVRKFSEPAIELLELNIEDVITTSDNCPNETEPDRG